MAALLDRALQISPLNPTARLAVAQLEPPRNRRDRFAARLGLSRDAVSLAWCARRLLAAGDKDDALKMYGKALEVATPDEPSRAGHAAIQRRSQRSPLPAARRGASARDRARAAREKRVDVLRVVGGASQEPDDVAGGRAAAARSRAGAKPKRCST